MPTRAEFLAYLPIAYRKAQRANAKRHALAARNLTGNQNLDGTERSERAARIHDLTRDHTQPQMELPL